MKLPAVLAALTLITGAAAFAQSNSPEIGTWVLNVAKSSYSPGRPPKGETRTYEAVGNAIRLTVKLEGAGGQTSVTQLTYTLDGKPIQISGNPGFDQVVGKRISSKVFRSTNLRNGKAVAETVASVSADGKTLTLTQDIPMGSGLKIHNVEVFDKQ